MSDPNWYSILPPILAIILAISTKQVILSLFSGIWMGFTIMSGFNPLAGVTASLDGISNVRTIANILDRTGPDSCNQLSSSLLIMLCTTCRPFISRSEITCRLLLANMYGVIIP